MDFENLVRSIAAQFRVIWAAPFPFIVVVAIVAIAIWKAMEWRYAGIIARLRDEVEHRSRAEPRHQPVIPEGRNPKESSAAISPPSSNLEPTQEPRLSDVALARYGDDISLPETITPAFLFDLCKGKTSIQCEGAVAVYMGQRLKVSGTIFAATRMGSATTVGLKPADVEGPQDLYMIFEGDRERISVMQEGDSLTATGRITELSNSGMKLADCRLL